MSLVLIVAIAVGYVARKSEVASERDARLSTQAELGAGHVSGVIDATNVAARSGSSATTVAEALAGIHPELGLCVVDADTAVCGGDGPQPGADVVEAEQLARETRPNDERDTEVIVYDGRLAVRAVGPALSVITNSPVTLDNANAARTSVTTLLPAGGTVGDFSVHQGQRQTSAMVVGAPGVFVVASGSDAVNLPQDELRFYVIVFTLALVLLVLAGITMFIEQRSLLERASFDTLTRLPNRSEFERRTAEILEHAGRDATGVCLLLFDLNGFKSVNDTYGHHAGDELLKVVGSRLRRAVRDGDVVARWGGDEFVVAMPGISTEEMGGRRARQLIEQIAGRTRIEGVDEPIRVRASVGVAIWPDHGPDLERLVVAADHAMYEAKRDGLVCCIAAPIAGPASPTETPLPV